MQTVFFALFLSSVHGANLLARSPSPVASKCTDFEFNLDVPASIDFGFAVPAATYNISATYCPPLKTVTNRTESLQFLIHGATGNKLYWSGLAAGGPEYQPFNYSWADFARQQGYHTLAIDRLGCGNSSQPDPTLVRTTPEVEIVSQIIEILHAKGSRDTKTSIPLNFLPAFSTIILNGFSFGSLVIDVLLNNPPSPSAIALINATILTGYSHIPNPHGNPNVTAVSQQFGPASQIFPKRFKTLNPGYRSIINAPNYAHSFFAGSYNPAVPASIWSREDVQATGEVGSLGAGASSFNISSVASYHAPLAIVAGQFDGPLCGGDCGGAGGVPDFLAMSKHYFPGVSQGKYFSYRVPQTGHMLHYHESARNTTEIVHAWLERMGL